MTWIWVFLAIGVIGLVTMIMWAVWLAHKASDVWSEVAMLGRRGEEFVALLGEIEVHRELTANTQVERHPMV